MNWWESIIVGLKGLGVHKVRAFLSMLGIIFGVSSVMAVLSVVEGARAEMMKQLRALGSNSVLVQFRRLNSERVKRLKHVPRGLTVTEAQTLARQCKLIEAHAPLRKSTVQVSLGGRTLDCEVVGTTHDFLRVSDFEVIEGRWLVRADERDCRRVCVLEEEIRQELFPLRSSLREKIIVNHEYYTVVGVLRGKEVSDSKVKVVDIKKLNRRIYIPLSCSLHRTNQSGPHTEIDEIAMKVTSADHVRTAAAVIDRFFEKAHEAEGVPLSDRNYQVKIALDLFKQTQKTQVVFDIVMGCSAGISLLVGGIGIMNIMLANVNERRREVGIRRSVGARESDILRQFMIEALGICLFGGVLGVGLGLGLTWGIAHFAEWKTLVSIKGLVLSLAVSLTDGLVFGTYPAWKAAKLDPIEALRYE